jgi:hypothetical protein
MLPRLAILKQKSRTRATPGWSVSSPAITGRIVCRLVVIEESSRGVRCAFLVGLFVLFACSPTSHAQQWVEHKPAGAATGLRIDGEQRDRDHALKRAASAAGARKVDLGSNASVARWLRNDLRLVRSAPETRRTQQRVSGVDRPAASRSARSARSGRIHHCAQLIAAQRPAFIVSLMGTSNSRSIDSACHFGSIHGIGALIAASTSCLSSTSSGGEKTT